MAKKKVTEKVISEIVFPSRPVICVPNREIDLTVETIQGKSHTVAELYQDYVLGRLDQSMLSGTPVYDEGLGDVDPLNCFGITLEEATRISDDGTKAAAEVREHENKKQEEIRAKEEAEAKAKLRKEIEEEMKATD